MRRFAVLLVLVAAFAVPGAASGHFGDIWFDTAAKTARNVEDKFPTVVAARCYRLPTSDVRRFNAHSILRNDTRMWDHFQCILAIRGGAICFSVAHITGQRWSDFYLTSYYYRGCTPYQLRR